MHVTYTCRPHMEPSATKVWVSAHPGDIIPARGWGPTEPRDRSREGPGPVSVAVARRLAASARQLSWEGVQSPPLHCPASIRQLSLGAPLSSPLLFSMHPEAAEEVYRQMVQEGMMWKLIGQSQPLDDDRPIEMLSMRNLGTLRRKVGALTEEERMFKSNLYQQPWFLTQFCHSESSIRREDGTVCLISYDRRRLIDPEAHTNAASVDIEQFANTNFVFLYLEIGKTLKKKANRSGGAIIVRTSLDQEAMGFAMSMHGDIFDGLRANQRLRIPEHDRRSLNTHLSRFEDDPLNDYNGFARTVFYAPKAIKEGTVLQIILDLRQVPLTIRDEVLTRQGSDELNNVVSSMSRTQVMVPEACVLSDFEIHRR